MNAKLVALLACTAVVLAAAAPARADVNGEVVSVDGIQILRVWGTPYEMGYAQGSLVGDRIMEIFNGYLPAMTTAWEYNLAYDLFDWLYTVPEEFADEAQGLFDGGLAAGMSAFTPFLGRNVNVKDVAVIGASADLFGLFACSALVAWAERTAGDEVLAGDAAIGRNLDWTPVQSDLSWLARRSLVVARRPAHGRPTISVAFPGFLGCLSCMNDAGVSAVQHQSEPNPPLGELDFSSAFVPINLSIRQILEQDDVDGDGVFSADDVAEWLAWFPRSSAYNVIVLGADYADHPPVVVELNNSGSAMRHDADDPALPRGTLAATNSLRKLAPPSPGGRYDTIVDNVNAWRGEITLARLWETCGDVEMNNEGQYYGDITAQTMIFIPALRRIGLSYADEQHLAPEHEPTWLEWNDVFGLTGDDDTTDDDANDDDANDDASSGDDDSSGCGC